MATRIKLRWNDKNSSEEGHKVYRSQAPMDPNDPLTLPAPLAVLAPNVTYYEDLDVVEDEFYRYRVSAFNSSTEMFSSEVEVQARVINFTPELEVMGSVTTYASSTSFDFAPPAGFEPGDLAYVAVSMNTNATLTWTTTGWSSVGETSSGTSLKGVMRRKVVPAEGLIENLQGTFSTATTCYVLWFRIKAGTYRNTRIALGTTSAGSRNAGGTAGSVPTNSVLVRGHHNEQNMLFVSLLAFGSTVTSNVTGYPFPTSPVNTVGPRIALSTATSDRDAPTFDDSGFTTPNWALATALQWVTINFYIRGIYNSPYPEPYVSSFDQYSASSITTRTITVTTPRLNDFVVMILRTVNGTPHTPAGWTSIYNTAGVRVVTKTWDHDTSSDNPLDITISASSGNTNWWVRMLLFDSGSSGGVARAAAVTATTATPQFPAVDFGNVADFESRNNYRYNIVMFTQTSTSFPSFSDYPLPRARGAFATTAVSSGYGANVTCSGEFLAEIGQTSVPAQSITSSLNTSYTAVSVIVNGRPA